MGWSSINGLILISGAFGLFDKEIAIKAGGYNHNTVGEDMELVVRMRKYMADQKIKYLVKFIPEPLCWTEAPSSNKILSRQRNRWTRGSFETLWLHKKLLLNPKYGVLGIISIPYWFFFEWMAPIIEFGGFILLIVFAILGYVNWPFFFVLLILVYVFSVLFSILSIVFEELSFPQYRKPTDIFKLILTAMAEPILAHPRMVWWAIMGNIDLIKGKKNWGEMTRTGFQKK